MQIDQESLYDLSIFSREDGTDVFEKLNFCITARGKDQLRANLLKQHASIDEILQIQRILKTITTIYQDWPISITNGTIMVMEKFLQAGLDPIPTQINTINAFSYKWLHPSDYSLIKYSIPHFINFLKGLTKICSLLKSENTPVGLKIVLDEINHFTGKEPLIELRSFPEAATFNTVDLLKAAEHCRYAGKDAMEQLLSLFGKLDAWYGMAMAAKNLGLSYPEFSEEDGLFLQSKGLFHLLLKDPVAYDIQLGGDRSMLFLTGANMAGKSTFIRAIGTAVYLAHAGMAVPAREMQLSCFDGLISNIQIRDDISKGESYFFNEVMRIRDTVIKISDRKKWIVLIDELFKGTNMEDAMKCSQAVIEGLLRAENCIFILSTHLYELAASLIDNPKIDFRYFQTSVKENELSFSYRLLEGVSTDRLGYLILTREGVLKLLQGLG